MTELNHAQFLVADFTAAGELICSERYTYAALEAVPGGAKMLGFFAGCLWRQTAAFDEPIPDSGLRVRWRQTGSMSGIATIRDADNNVLQLSLILGGDAEDATQVAIVQQHLVTTLHDSGFEPAFDLTLQTDRPLLVSLALCAPGDPLEKWLFALADRCLAAAFLRKRAIDPWVA